MPNESRCHLTVRDFSLLEAMMDRCIHSDESFLRLLRRKLSTATVVFNDDIDPQVATINSRVAYSIDGGPIDRRILVDSEESTVLDSVLSISTLRGLALLGLTTGETILVQRSDGTTETLRMDEVVHQPEAARKAGMIRAAPAGDELRSAASSVVDFAARRKPTAEASLEAPLDPNDDDPGPRAA